MKYIFIGYPRCSTSRKAQKWLDEHHIEYIFRHIVEEKPSAQELEKWQKQSNLPLKRFFNTSGQLYRSLNLKDRLPSMTEKEQFELLSTDGMLVKRPILLADQFILIGFKEAEWSEKLL